MIQKLCLFIMMIILADYWHTIHKVYAKILCGLCVIMAVLLLIDICRKKNLKDARSGIHNSA